jgi:putative MATE family efflux protein
MTETNVLIQESSPAVSNREMRRSIFRLAWPVIVENMLMSLVSMADMIMVGSLGPAAIASIGLSNSPIFFSMAMFAAISVGSTALVARHIGAKEPDRANLMARQSFMLAVVLSIAFTIAVFFAAPYIMDWMGADDEVKVIGASYVRISTSTFGFAIVSMIMNGVLRGAGDTKTPMRVNIVANLVNVVFNYLLIHGKFGFPTMGVNGAAAATALSRMVGGLLVLRVLTSGKLIVHISLKDSWRFDWAAIRRMMNIGVPAMLEQFVMRGGQLLFSRVVSSLGTLAYAAHSIAHNVESLSFMPGFGFAMAATTLVGQNLGARLPERAEHSGYESMKIAATIMSFVGLILFLIPGLFVRMYTNDVQVIQMSSDVLRIIAVSQPFLAGCMVFAGALRGAGDTRWVLIITIIGTWCVRLALAYFLCIILDFGLVGAWLAMAADLCLRCCLVWLRYRTGRWKTLKV